VPLKRSPLPFFIVEQIATKHRMKKSCQCPKCGSKEIVKDAKVIDRSDGGWEEDMSVATFRQPDAVIFKGKAKSTVSAWICASCGFVELYADSPEAIHQSNQ
jgi:predicted nucleic-acid-binding Zn-ribbon protein